MQTKRISKWLPEAAQAALSSQIKIADTVCAFIANTIGAESLHNSTKDWDITAALAITKNFLSATDWHPNLTTKKIILSGREHRYFVTSLEGLCIDPCIDKFSSYKGEYPFVFMGAHPCSHLIRPRGRKDEGKGYAGDAGGNVHLPDTIQAEDMAAIIWSLEVKSREATEGVDMIWGDFNMTPPDYSTRALLIKNRVVRDKLQFITRTQYSRDAVNAYLSGLGDAITHNKTQWNKFPCPSKWKHKKEVEINFNLLTAKMHMVARISSEVRRIVMEQKSSAADWSKLSYRERLLPIIEYLDGLCAARGLYVPPQANIIKTIEERYGI